MNKLVIDFETYSDRGINDGYNNYFQTINSRVLCMAWKINAEPTKIWIPHKSPDLYPFVGYDWDPARDKRTKVYAHNAHFDFRCWNSLCVPHYGWPELHLSQVIDIMAICGRFTYPLGLDRVAAVLRLKNQKDKRGKALLKLNWAEKRTTEEFVDLVKYCIRDVNAEAELLSQLPSDILSEEEQRYWEDTVTVNEIGLPIDIGTVKQIHRVLESFIKSKVKVIDKLTGGRVQTVKQIQKMLAWLEEEGVELPNLQIKTVENALDGPLPEKPRKLLELRAELSQSSVAKYATLIKLFHAATGRVYDNLYYHKASTGRYAGRGFQGHNLPRAKVDNPEVTIAEFFNYNILYKDPLTAAKALIRSVIKAPKGRRLVVVDYKSIENIGLLWAAGQEDLLEEFRLGNDLYKVMAAELFGIPYESIDKEKRFHGKTLELGAGYCLSGKGYVKYAASFGLVGLTESDGEHAIGIYRESHDLVVEYWKGLNRAALSAVRGTPRGFRKVVFKKIKDRNGRLWLTMRLPSGRMLYYADPRIDQGDYGDIITHMGINSYTQKWVRMDLTRGRITENVIQGMCRDLLATAVRELLTMRYKVILHVHDEIIVEVDKAVADLEFGNITKVMECPPKWAEGLPVKTEGFITKRYKKD